MIVFDAADAFTTIITAAIAWVEALAAAALFVLCVIAWSVGPLVAPRVKATVRRVAGPSWRRGRRKAREYARTHARRSQGRTQPRWATEQPINDHHDDYSEAA